MKRNKILYQCMVALTAAFIFSGCYKDKTVYLDVSEEITRPVSFAADVIPIFNSSCNQSGCHNSGGKSPDLSISNAYNSLQNGGYLNLNSPENSELYLWMSGKKGTPMPLSGVNKKYNAMVLAWLKQGCKNN